MKEERESHLLIPMKTHCGHFPLKGYGTLSEFLYIIMMKFYDENIMQEEEKLPRF